MQQVSSASLCQETRAEMRDLVFQYQKSVSQIPQRNLVAFVDGFMA